jgi:hypothetical protein
MAATRVLTTGSALTVLPHLCREEEVGRGRGEQEDDTDELVKHVVMVELNSQHVQTLVEVANADQDDDNDDDDDDDNGIVSINNIDTGSNTGYPALAATTTAAPSIVLQP